MPQPDLVSDAARILEPTLRPHVPVPAMVRLRTLQRLVRAIEDELADAEICAEQKLQNIGERIAAVMNGE